MKRLRHRWKAFVNTGSILGLTFALVSHAQSMPEAPGRAEFQRTCTTCHSATVATSKRLTESGWENVVENMVSRGAQATPDELQQIVKYLTANFGAGAAAPEGAPSGKASVPPAQPAAPALDASQVARAQQLIQSNGCLSCHRLNGEGSYAGPYLGDVGTTRSAEQIRSSLVSPNKELAPQNRSVRLITQDGKTVTGKLLNQDGFSVQLIDAAGHLLSFERANLRDFTIITANPMPAYANKMAPDDLALLIKYLRTQTDKSQQ